MKLKDIKIFKSRSKAELLALLPELIKEQQKLKLNQQPTAEVKYKIALIKTICNN